MQNKAASWSFNSPSVARSGGLFGGFGGFGGFGAPRSGSNLTQKPLYAGQLLLSPVSPEWP